MGRIKVAWVAAVMVAAMAVMAVGASSASASTTQLCTVSTSPCPAGDAYAAGSKFKVKGEFVLTGVTGCAVTYEMQVGSSGGSSVLAKMISFSFSSCSNGTPTPLHLTWNYPIFLHTTPNGIGEVQSGGTGSPGFSVGSCVFENPFIPQEVKGGSITTVTTSANLTGTGTGCPASSTLGIGGTATPSIYVTS